MRGVGPAGREESVSNVSGRSMVMSSGASKVVGK